MAKPVILALDDEPTVLNAVDRDLRAQYGREYRILKAASGKEALRALKELQLRNQTAALFLVDQRMPEMTGVEFLLEARRLFPEAKRALLTAYADIDAAIGAINEAGLDHYLMKPWDPPDEKLYPVLDDLLEDWSAHIRMPFEGIRVAGTIWSPASHTVRDFLASHQIPYQWLDVDRDAKARDLAEEVSEGRLRVPTVLFPDGTALVEPPIEAIAERVGMPTRAALPFYDLIILGAGPAGLAAAVFASSEGVQCLMIERRAPGGLAGRSPKIENYLGFPKGISGAELARRAMTQARRLGAEVLMPQEATRVRVQDGYRVVTLSDGAEISSHTVLVATGALFQTLKMPGAADLTGAGVYYGTAHTEAHFHKGEDVFVVGGANSAAQGALYLSRFARKVTVVIRGPEPVCAQHLADEMVRNDRVEFLLNAELLAVKGQERFEAIVVRDNATGEEKTYGGDGMFVFIGVKPQSGLVADLVETDAKGYVLTGPDLLREGRRPKDWSLDRDPFLLETSVPGIFAAGDVRHGTSHRVSSATSEGGIAVAMVREYMRNL